jgi:hypothetical protein
LVQAKGWFGGDDAFFSSLTLKGGAAALQTQQAVPFSFFTTLVANNPSLVDNIQLPNSLLVSDLLKLT